MKKHTGAICIPVLVHTGSRKVIGLLVCGPVDELAQAGDRDGTNQSVAAEGPAVHHPDVQRRMKQLVLRQILTHQTHNHFD